jgi:hypothetical protein
MDANALRNEHAFGGMIIALVFFSPLAEVFDLKPAAVVRDRD